MVSEIFMAAFHDEMAKVAGAKRVDRLYKLRDKSPGHRRAYEKAWKAYEGRIGRYGLPEKHRIDPSKNTKRLRDDPKIAGLALGTSGPLLAGGITGALIDPGLGWVVGFPGTMLGSAAGTVGGEGVRLARNFLYDQRRTRATKNYLRRIGVPRESVDSYAKRLNRKPSPYIRRSLDSADFASISSRAVRAGSPKDVPAELLRIGQRATPAQTIRKGQEVAAEARRKKDKARLQGYLAGIRSR